MDTVGTADVHGPPYRQCVQQCSLLQQVLGPIIILGPVRRSCSVIG